MCVPHMCPQRNLWACICLCLCPGVHACACARAAGCVSLPVFVSVCIWAFVSVCGCWSRPAHRTVSGAVCASRCICVRGALCVLELCMSQEGCQHALARLFAHLMGGLGVSERTVVLLRLWV